jgi:hypothetical protein
MDDLSLPISPEALRQLGDDLSSLVAPNETAFIALGDALASARGKLRAAGEEFRTLAEKMDQGDGLQAARALAGARDEILRISEESRGVAAGLTALNHTLDVVRRPVAVLSKIIGEVAALATNAKVQAAQVSAGGVDFSVFTKDIDRLRGLAEQAVHQAAGRLTSLGATMATACAESEAFHRGDAAELAAVATRLKEQLAELSERREQARRCLADFQRRAVAIGERVSRCIGALQINDMTSQRIGHVQTALSLLTGVVNPGAALEPGCEWVGELSGERRRLLLGTVCSLQATQLERASCDFSAAIGELRTNLSALREDAEAMMAETRQVFASRHGDETFIHGVLAEVQRAMALLHSYCRADETIRARIEELSQGFAAMTADLEAIQSIDADMRIMGLNATLKCTRLGRSGLALGVVAQELRACSRRTEETSKAIAAAITTVSGDASTLTARSAHERETATALVTRMSDSADILNGFSQVLNAALNEMAEACGEVASLLDEAAQGFAVEQALNSGVSVVAKRLKAVGDECAGPDADPSLVREDIHRMLGQHYTMASERVIHELFADGSGGTAAPADNSGTPAAEAPDDDIDSLFF